LEISFEIFVAAATKIIGRLFRPDAKTRKSPIGCNGALGFFDFCRRDG